jgi:hypothetical protein
MSETLQAQKRPQLAGFPAPSGYIIEIIGLIGWRHSADRTGLRLNSPQTGNFAGNLRIFA